MNPTAKVAKLENGLEIVYLQNSSAPVLALDLWVRAGSADETPAEAGIAHVVEHMMFKGTKRRGPGQMAGEVEDLGGEINAYTSFDHTVYTLAVAGRYAREGMDLLSDAIANPAFDQEELAREKLVILEEIKRMRDLPQQYLSRLLFSTAYKKHPYGLPVIGTEESVKSFTSKDLRNFVAKWYRPSNMTLVGVGELPMSAVVKLAGEYFGPLAPKPAPKRAKRPVEPVPEGLRAVIEPRQVSEVYFDLAFPGPSALSKDVPALELLSAVLGNGESSRLQHRVKLDLNLVYGISAGLYLPHDPGILYVGGVLEQKKLKEALSVVSDELFRLVSEPVDSAELIRARETVEADFIFQRETAQAQAQKIGYCHVVLKDASYEERYLKGLAEVTQDDIKDVARRYLVPDRATVALLHPKKSKAPITEAGLRDILRGSREGWLAKKPAQAGPSLTRTVLKSGARILVKENPSVPIVALRAAMPGGSRYEDEKTLGISHLMADLLARGTTTRTVFDIAMEGDRIGGYVEGFSGRNSFGIKAEFLSRHLDAALDLVVDMLKNPSFPPAEIEKARDEALSAIRRRDDNPAGKAFRAFEKALYGGHPYGNDPLGNLESVARFGREHIAEAYERFFAPHELSVAVAGKVDAKEIVRELERKLNLVRKPRAVLKAPKPPRELKGTRVEKVYSHHEQAHIVLGFLGATVDDPARLALKVAVSVLTGQGGRLFRKLRDEKGLAYSVSCSSMEGVDRGYVAGYIATSHDRRQEALDGLLEEFNLLLRKGFTPDEIERAKRKIAGNYEISLQENDFQATEMALDDLYGQDYRKFTNFAKSILKIRPADVESAVEKFITPEKWVAVTTEN